MTDNNENARALAEAMLNAGREPLWCVLVVGWYFGRQGREEALALVEQHGIDPSPSALE
jgi:hypothetical protein